MSYSLNCLRYAKLFAEYAANTLPRLPKLCSPPPNERMSRVSPGAGAHIFVGMCCTQLINPRPKWGARCFGGKVALGGHVGHISCGFRIYVMSKREHYRVARSQAPRDRAHKSGTRVALCYYTKTWRMQNVPTTKLLKTISTALKYHKYQSEWRPNRFGVCVCI